MQLLSTLAFLAVAIQCAVAAPERNLLRSGYDRPINFSDLADLKHAATNPTTLQQPKHGSSAAPSSVDSTPKSEISSAGASTHDKKSAILPDAKSQHVGGSNNKHGKNVVETDSTTLAGRSGLQSVMGGKGAGNEGKRPTKSNSGTETTKRSSATTNNGMKAYSLLSKSEVPEERTLANPRKRPTPRIQGKYY